MAGAVYKMYSFDRSSSDEIGFTIDLTTAKPGDAVELDDVSEP